MHILCIEVWTNMKKKLLLLTFILGSLITFSQKSINSDYSAKELIKVGKMIIKDGGICSLITIDKEGIARARAMDGFAPEEDLTIWFGTHSQSRKVEQIKNNPKVSLYYLDKDNSGYVLIHGKAELINDLKTKKKYWKDHWDAYYPDTEKDYLLIKVTPIWIEVLSDKHGIKNDPKNWEVPRVDFQL